MNSLKKVFLVVVMMVMSVFSLCGCMSNDQDSNNETNNKKEYELEFSSEEYVLALGEIKDMGIIFTLNDSTADVNLLDINSSEENVVKIENNKIRALAVGKSVISAKFEEKTAKATVLVVADATAEQINGFDEKYINIYGRSYISNGKLSLDHTANAVEIGIAGSSLTAKIHSTAISYMQIYIDGSEYGMRQEISAGEKDYVLVSGLKEGYHKIRLVKATEMQNACWKILSFKAERFTCVPEKPELKIEFIGDSITAGYGSLGKEGDSWSVENSDCTRTYAYVAARKLKADYSIIAWSGICTKAYHWAKDINMVDLYDRVSYTNTEKYAHNFMPDIIVINLGSNEASYLNINPAYAEEFPNDYSEFISSVRKNNPNAYIICLYGMTDNDSSIYHGIESSCEKLNDQKIFFNPFKIIQNNSGANGHPSSFAQSEWGNLLVDFIENNLLK